MVKPPQQTWRMQLALRKGRASFSIEVKTAQSPRLSRGATWNDIGMYRDGPIYNTAPLGGFLLSLIRTHSLQILLYEHLNSFSLGCTFTLALSLSLVDGQKPTPPPRDAPQNIDPSSTACTTHRNSTALSLSLSKYSKTFCSLFRDYIYKCSFAAPLCGFSSFDVPLSVCTLGVVSYIKCAVSSEFRVLTKFCFLSLEH